MLYLDLVSVHMPHVVRFIWMGRQARHFAGLRYIMNINEVQRSNGVTRRNLVVEWCAFLLRPAFTRSCHACHTTRVLKKFRPDHEGKEILSPKYEMSLYG